MHCSRWGIVNSFFSSWLSTSRPPGFIPSWWLSFWRVGICWSGRRRQTTSWLRRSAETLFARSPEGFSSFTPDGSSTWTWSLSTLFLARRETISTWGLLTSVWPENWEKPNQWEPECAGTENVFLSVWFGKKGTNFAGLDETLILVSNVEVGDVKSQPRFSLEIWTIPWSRSRQPWLSL